MQSPPPPQYGPQPPARYKSKPEKKKKTPLRIFVYLLIVQIVVVALVAQPLGDVPRTYDNGGRIRYCTGVFGSATIIITIPTTDVWGHESVYASAYGMDFTLTHYKSGDKYGEISSLNGTSHTKGVLSTTYYIVATTLVLSILSIILIVLISLELDKGIDKILRKITLSKILLIISIITMILIILAPIYFLLTFPSALNADILESMQSMGGNSSNIEISTFPFACIVFLIAGLSLQLGGIRYIRAFIKEPFRIKSLMHR